MLGKRALAECSFVCGRGWEGRSVWIRSWSRGGKTEVEECVLSFSLPPRCCVGFFLDFVLRLRRGGVMGTDGAASCRQNESQKKGGGLVERCVDPEALAEQGCLLPHQRPHTPTIPPDRQTDVECKRACLRG